MTVKELMEQLAVCDPEAKVVGYDALHSNDFWIKLAVEDAVIDSGYSDGFTKEYTLKKFITNGTSAVCREMLGQSIVVLC